MFIFLENEKIVSYFSSGWKKTVTEMWAGYLIVLYKRVFYFRQTSVLIIPLGQLSDS